MVTVAIVVLLLVQVTRWSVALAGVTVAFNCSPLPPIPMVALTGLMEMLRTLMPVGIVKVFVSFQSETMSEMEFEASL